MSSAKTCPNRYDLILDVNVIQHDLRNQVLQRPIDKPDNKEELLKFVYPNIGYNDGQVTVTAKDVKDHAHELARN